MTTVADKLIERLRDWDVEQQGMKTKAQELFPDR